MEEKTYLCIDLKSFYASVECVARGLDPLTTNLVVADESRTEKTICLAVSPSMKTYGISGRARLFEVVETIRKVNALRSAGKTMTGSSTDATQLKADPTLLVDYLVAPPRMALYMEHSTAIYSIYLKYLAPEDIHQYSVDEVFMDLTPYLKTYRMSPHELAMTMIRQVLEATGITATAGIGTNLYLAKIAMDILAKRMPPDENGVRIAELNELEYRRSLWDHQPITDFWRVGRGSAKRLADNGLYTMGDIARCSVGKPDDFYNEELLYRLFGVNAELLIDHAWGWEPCTIAQIKAYRPETNSVSSGQVLSTPYPWEKARLVTWEMADNLAMDLFAKGLSTDQVVLTIGYDRENLDDPVRRKQYHGPVTQDVYGRLIPKHSHGTANFPRRTASGTLIAKAVTDLFDRITDPNLLVRRITLCAAHLLPEMPQSEPEEFRQMDLFSDPEEERRKEAEEARLEREKRRQKAVLTIRTKYGKNAIFRGENLREGATSMERNGTIGGHKA